MTITSSMRRFGLCLLLLLAAAAAAAATPRELRGTWEVVQVALDTRDQPHWRYEPNDPRILGRILTLGNDGQITFNYKRERCDRVTWANGPKTTLAKLIEQSFPRPPREGAEGGPALADFGLKLPNQPLRPLRALCAGADQASPQARWGDAWFVPLKGDKLLVAYDSDTILVLKKARPAAVAATSFSCRRGALNAAEQAVCASPALAAYDRSVAAAYQRSLRRRAGESDAVKAEQRAWLTSRDSCQSDAACLEDRMRARIEALMQD